MAFALLIIGAVLLISAVRNTSDDLFGLIKGDFTNQNGPSFIYWMTAILLIGLVGYVPKLKPLSVSLLGLVVLVLFLTRGNPTGIGGGFFEKFTAGLASSTTPQQQQPAMTVGNVINPGTSVPSGGQGSPVTFYDPGFVPATQPTLEQLGALSPISPLVQ